MVEWNVVVIEFILEHVHLPIADLETVGGLLGVILIRNIYYIYIEYLNCKHNMFI